MHFPEGLENTPFKNFKFTFSTNLGLLGKKLKPLPKGKIKCCVPGCDSHNNKIPKPSFYRFPARNHEQCKLWIKAINKKNPDGSDWQPKSQLISELLFDMFNFPKKRPFFMLIMLNSS